MLIIYIWMGEKIGFESSAARSGDRAVWKIMSLTKYSNESIWDYAEQHIVFRSYD